MYIFFFHYFSSSLHPKDKLPLQNVYKKTNYFSKKCSHLGILTFITLEINKLYRNKYFTLQTIRTPKNTHSSWIRYPVTWLSLDK